MFPRIAFVSAVLALPIPALVAAGEPDDTFKWMSETEDVLAEGIIWNDRFGDAEDRYKTGGMTQSWLLPQSIFSDRAWFDGQAAAIELQGRGFIATPNNTAQPVPGDRPFAQYVGVGGYLRTFSAPDPVSPEVWLTTELRLGVELGYQGDPLPLFEIQDALHSSTGMGAMRMTPANTLQSEVLVNAEAKRTWRWHKEMDGYDLEFAPYMMVSAGMRENSFRAGGDIILGSSLTARTWNHDTAIGALIPGGSAPRDGVNWVTWVGADAGLIFTDALLDGGFDGTGPGVDREQVTVRARAGVMLEYDDFAISYSATWLSPEFTAQNEGQLIGAFQIKYRF